MNYSCIEIKSKDLRATLSTLGAELKNITLADGFEFLWQGKQGVWERTSPILFPITGRFPNDFYFDREQPYYMPMNGFAQNACFEVIEISEAEVALRLKSNTETLRFYPYIFLLDVRFGIIGNRLKISFSVTNRSRKEMPYSVGNHTGFRWPLLNGDLPDDYYLEFDKKESLQSFNPFGWTDTFISGETIRPLSKKMFRNGTRSIRGVRSEWIRYTGENCPYSVRMESSQFPFTAFWTLPLAQAKYLCIEPSKSISSNGPTFFDREGISWIKPGQCEKSSYTLIFENKK